MKKLIILTIVALAAVANTYAQSSSEVFVGYSFLKQDVKSNRALTRFDENTDSHGFVGSYSHYLLDTKVFGLTGEFGANFDDNKASLVTAMGGVIFKANTEKTIRPFGKALAGYARQAVDRRGILNTTDASKAYSLGGGADFVVNKNYQIRVGADYINTGFAGVRQNSVRFSTGLVF